MVPLAARIPLVVVLVRFYILMMQLQLLDTSCRSLFNDTLPADSPSGP